jgi:hypothetical protein
MLTLVYDANRSPISFDFCWALAWAELSCRSKGTSSFDIVILDIGKDFRHHAPEEHPDFVDYNELAWRVREILLPIARLHRQVGRVSLVPRECEKELRDWVLPESARNMLLSMPHDPTKVYRDVIAAAAAGITPRGFTAGNAGARAADMILGREDSRKHVVITIRQSRGGAVRNSNISAWRAFGHTLDPASFRIVVIPDTEQAWTNDFPKQWVISEAAFNMELRMALYERAFLNMFVNSGPASLCILSPNTSYLLFKLLSDGERLTTREFVESLGFEAGKTPPLATSWQRWIWQPDTLSVLQQSFSEFLKCRGLPEAI